MKEKWDKRFWDLAQFVAEWSKDPRAKVGAILISNRGNPIALGYNGFPMGVEDSAHRLKNKNIKNDMVVHAEQNALLIAGDACAGAQLYVWGKPICAKCAGIIIQSGISRVIATNPFMIEKTSKWRETGIRAIQMFREAHVKIKYMNNLRDHGK